MLKRIIFCLFLVFVFQSCENLSEPGEAEYKNSIVFKFKTGNAKHQLYVYHTYPISFLLGSPYYSDNYSNPLAGDAKISIISDNSIYSNFGIEEGDSALMDKYYTNRDDLLIEPNTNYSINIEVNGEEITGEIKTVGNFEILDINELYSGRDYTSFKLTWERCENARFYRQTIYSSSHSQLAPSYILDIDTIDNVDKLTNKIILAGKYSSLIIGIEAYDQNSYDYFIKKQKQAGVENAYGYLGSYTVKEKKIYFNN